MLDFYLKENITNDSIKVSIAKGLNVNTERVITIKDITTVEPKKPADIYCEISETRGEFLLHVRVFAPETIPDSITTYKSLANAFNTDILTSDDKIHTDTWLILSPDGEKTPVYADIEDIENDNIRIQKHLNIEEYENLP